MSRTILHVPFLTIHHCVSTVIILFIPHTGWPNTLLHSNTLLPLLTLCQYSKIVLIVVETTMLWPSILNFLG